VSFPGTEPQKYVKVQIIVTDDEDEGYHFTAFKCQKPLLNCRDVAFSENWFMQDRLVPRTEEKEFVVRFTALPDRSIDDQFGNIYVWKKLPRPEGEESDGV
jgi:hypothetical protein